MNREELRDYRRRHVPVFNDQKLKLGIFALNCSGGNVITTLPKGDQMTWNYNRNVIQLADRAGMEIALPSADTRARAGRPTTMATASRSILRRPRWRR